VKLFLRVLLLLQPLLVIDRLWRRLAAADPAPTGTCITRDRRPLENKSSGRSSSFCSLHQQQWTSSWQQQWTSSWQQQWTSSWLPWLQ
jgi:hypothetical protein